MRRDCRYFETRTYANGETVRKCDLDLAPEAPWRCPDDCPRFSRRLADVSWQYGSLVTPELPDAPEGEAIAELLDEAEDIVNAAGPSVLAEVEAEARLQAARSERRSGKGGGLSRLLGRFRRS